MFPNKSVVSLFLCVSNWILVRTKLWEAVCCLCLILLFISAIEGNLFATVTCTSLATKDFEVKTAFLATAGFGVLFYYNVFPIHKGCLNKHRFHTWEFYILCSAEAHFKWQGEKKRICCLQKRVFGPHMITEGEIKVVIGSLIEFWLLLLLIKSMGLFWSCSFSFNGSVRDVLTGHCNHGHIVIRLSHVAVLLQCDHSGSMMIQRMSCLFKDKLCWYFSLQTEETNYLLNYGQSDVVPVVQPSVVCLLTHYTQSKLTVYNQLSNAIYSQEAIKLTAKV